MEICIRHNLYLQLCNLIFSYFRIKWNQLFENQNMQKKKRKKQKKQNLIRELSVTLWGGGLKNTALFSLWLCALQQRCFWNFCGKLVSKYFCQLLCEKIFASLNSPPLLTPSHFSNNPSFLSYLPSGMRDWNSSHRRPLCYLYLFTMDYNALSQKTICANILRGPSWGEQGWSEWGRRREDGSEGPSQKNKLCLPFYQRISLPTKRPFFFAAIAR